MTLIVMGVIYFVAMGLGALRIPRAAGRLVSRRLDARRRSPRTA